MSIPDCDHPVPPTVITELFRLLPKPGDDFAISKRVAFLRAAIAIFDLIYLESPVAIDVTIDEEVIKK